MLMNVFRSALVLMALIGQTEGTPLLNGELKRPLITLTFDDGWNSSYETALPLLDWYQMYGTFYIISNVLGHKSYVSADQVVAIHQAGHEIGAHSIDHSDLATLLPSLVEEQLARPQKILENLIKAPVRNFAAPYGSVSPIVLKLLPKFYNSNRSSNQGYNNKQGFNRFGLKVQQIKSSTTIEDVERWVKFAIENKCWVILMYHQVDDGAQEWSTTPADFEKHLHIIKESGIPVVTIQVGVTEVLEQIINENAG